MEEIGCHQIRWDKMRWFCVLSLKMLRWSSSTGRVCSSHDGKLFAVKQGISHSRANLCCSPKSMIREWHDTNPLQMPAMSVFSAISFPFPCLCVSRGKCSTAAKKYKRVYVWKWTFLRIIDIVFGQTEPCFIYGALLLYFPCSLNLNPPPSLLSGLQCWYAGGWGCNAGEVTSNCYLTFRRTAANLRINLLSLCVHVCVRMCENLLQPVPASENREVDVTIRVRNMPLWLLLLTVSSWEHAGPPPADLEACQARLWCRSVSGGQARSSPRKENDTSKQEPPVLFPVESSSSLAAVTPGRLNAKWTGRRTGCRL